MTRRSDPVAPTGAAPSTRRSRDNQGLRCADPATSPLGPQGGTTMSRAQVTAEVEAKAPELVRPAVAARHRQNAYLVAPGRPVDGDPAPGVSTRWVTAS